jgi:hypothetical protein
MKIIENQPINAELQALIREFGNTLNVDSSLFLRKKDKTLENLFIFNLFFLLWNGLSFSVNRRKKRGSKFKRTCREFICFSCHLF